VSLQGWPIIAVAFGYLMLLFFVASYGDRRWAAHGPARSQSYIYALSLAIYCTSWTFFGSVGIASERGFEFLAIYIGPVLVYTVGFRLMRRMIRLAKAERITSIADFLAARYGKSFLVAALAAVIATVGAVPYIALQLKAISGALDLMMAQTGTPALDEAQGFGDFSFLIAAVLALFAALFGTRHADVTEHQAGMMLAIAVESVVKLASFLAIGLFVGFFLFASPFGLWEKVLASEQAMAALQYRTSASTWVALVFMSCIAVIALPRQFHVAIVENHSEQDLKTAAWLFPAYLVAINLFVIPIALAGVLTLGDSTNADLYILALPMSQNHDLLAIIVFVGGLSAATAMVIVASVAISIMISNDLVMPLVIRRLQDRATDPFLDSSQLILTTRRFAIAGIIFAAFLYYRSARDGIPLFSIGLLSFAAISQFAPALIGGLFWRRANARGALLGMGSGFLTWFVLLLLPTISGVTVLPDALPLPGSDYGAGNSDNIVTVGLFWSIVVNTFFYIAGSLSRPSTAAEAAQAALFVPDDLAPLPNMRRVRVSSVTADALESVVARYLGAERTRRSFIEYEIQSGNRILSDGPAPAGLVQFSEQLLGSAVGSSSARLILSLLFQRHDPAAKDTSRLLDDASEALQQNRDLLQIALDQMEQGITVLDRDLKLTCWNRQFRTLLGLPADFGRVGVSVQDIFGFLAQNDAIGSDEPRVVIDRLRQFGISWRINLKDRGKIIEIRSNPMPDGGVVATYADVTQAVMADLELKRANENLEQRVMDRTTELTRVNTALDVARRDADAANLSKTRFLAASGHDIMQPLNAARLYCSSLIERSQDGTLASLSSRIDSSLESVETVLAAVLDISRLDSGGMRPSLSRFPLSQVFEQVYTDLAPLAQAKGLDLRLVKTSTWIESDRNLFRRMLQNLISNAIKYTRSGTVLVGIRHRPGKLELQIHDTGIGISAKDQSRIFNEFLRLDEGVREAEGLGLGLSIVERISSVLQISLNFVSTEGKGTRFSLTLDAVEPESRGSASAAPGQDSGTAMSVCGVRVLCIDNEPTIQDGMRTLLEGWGCCVSTCGSKAAALALPADQPPDIVLADFHLNDGDGLATIDQLRKKWGADLPAYLLTADRSKEVRARARKRDVSVIHKPVKPAVIRSALAQSAKKALAAE
jgi:Na+/proline symporter/signal transduction histidine kinase/CheY-like chemotaxis protein